MTNHHKRGAGTSKVSTPTQISTDFFSFLSPNQLTSKPNTPSSPGYSLSVIPNRQFQSQQNCRTMKENLCMDIDPPLFNENLATAEDWRKTLSKVVPAVVVLRTTACRAFDTESAGVSSATGFVVDKRRGIILTNRHVVKPGPVMAEAMFVNREEIPVCPIYRDPVHDFGFFRYDPGAIQFLSYEEIPLAPDAASVGVEIRVVGNDSGEKVSILAGTLARLDRDAPQYKKNGYNDFNTFYMQAASGTKGGSSGSPVIDWQGRAVALNAGSKLSSASAFFLPLERVVRSLKFLQEGGYFSTHTWAAVTIPRGTLQMTFLHKGFDETRRLGVQRQTEQLVRNSTPPTETGMLVVDSVVPGGPAHNHLEPGDVLIRMNGEVVTQFLKMETLLDDSVEQKIELQIERGGTPLTVNLLVQDLHSITPDHFLEVSGAVIHPLSYQQARNFRFNCGLVYIAEPGYMLYRAGVPRHSIIKKFAGEGISRLEDLISVLSKLSRGARVPLEYINYKERHQKKVHVPSSCMLDGVHSQHFFGTGVIVYHSQTMGLVAVDKNTGAVPVSDVMLSFAAFPIEIPAEVVFLHPFHNFALVAYDPTALGAAAASVVRAAELLPEPALLRGDSVFLVGLSRSLQATSRKSIVTNPSAAVNIGSSDVPRYRATNMEVIELDTDFGSTFSGVLTDERGRVLALWGSFSTQLKYGSSSSEEHQFVRGIPIYKISQLVNRITSGTEGPPRLINGLRRPMPCIRILEVELYPTLLSKARSFGLSDAWIQALVKKDPLRRQVLQVKGCFAGSKAENLLEQGDMILAINKKLVTCFRDIEDACQLLDHSRNDDGKLDLTIVRRGNEIELLVGTDVRDGNGAKRAINWCGGILQEPYPAVRALGFLPEEGHGVYVARWCHGSPAHRHGLFALQWIVEVNGKPTPNLDAFVDVTKAIEHGEFVRVRSVHLNGKPRVLTLKQDLHYWPTWELRFDPETAMWRRKVIKSLDSSVL
ncbi:protease Do-like 7 isoform X5 [Capsicum annuum]|uniref:protease Do-like 7 isoform X5 n=1 Tax=Capsicum annuum TaxID=4072 RepID=UPI0007BF2F27|nr:protease Do-like 7 isoform X5 [Capsicum annuum]